MLVHPLLDPNAHDLPPTLACCMRKETREKVKKMLMREREREGLGDLQDLLPCPLIKCEILIDFP